MQWFFGKSTRERRLRSATLLALAFGLLFAVWVVTVDPLRSVQRVVADAQFRGQDASPNVVLVGIDDAALQTHGRLSQWPRSLHAQAVRNLKEAGAMSIVYDILFADEGQDDEEFAQAISEAGNVVLAVAGDGSPSPREDGYAFLSFTLPTKTLRDAGPALAAANLITDGDGRVRRVPLSVTDDSGQTFTSLSLAAMYRQFGRPLPEKLDVSGDELDAFGRSVPFDQNKTLRVDYVGGQDRFTTLTFDQVLNKDSELDLVAGKTVIVGLLATAADIQPAPLLGSAHGMEVHANALDTLLRSRFLRTTSDSVTFLTIGLFVLLAALIVPRWRPVFSLVAVVVVMVVYAVFGNVMFNQGRIVDFVDPSVGLVLATMVALSYSVVSERRSQRDLQELFGRYLSPQVAKELLQRADRGNLRLGGELREVTVLFGDIRGFTPLSARMPPEELVALLNQHFEVIISRIMENGGIVNKFAGDAVMALWNAPEDQPDHALLACKAALQAQDGLDALADPPVARWGFGISTGVALAGNVGSGRRLEYTVIGDSVNLAARLCGVAPAGEVWVSENTHRLVEGPLEGEELPPQQIKGIEAPVVAYRLKRTVPAQRMEVGG